MVTFVFNDTADFSGAHVTANVTDQVDLATIPGFIDFLTATEGTSNWGIAHSLEAKTMNVVAAYDTGDLNAAKGILDAFINEGQAQRGKIITLSAVDRLLNYASLLLEQLR
jgi:hypothetical protein